MRSLNSLFLFSFVLSSLISLISTTHPLIFNPFTLEIYDLRGMSLNISTPVYASACPAIETAHEREFNAAYSHGNKSLLMRGISYKRYQDAEAISCQKDFELSIVTSNVRTPNEGIVIELGYEVYFDSTEYMYSYSKIFKTSCHSDFGTVLEASKNYDSNPPPQKQKLGTLLNIQTPVVKQKPCEEGEYQHMGFIWLMQIRIRYHVQSWSVIRPNYKLYRNADQLRAEIKCENYNLGSEMYQNEQLDDFYEPENQRKIFEDVALPQSTLENGSCKTNHVCLEKYHSVPPFVFQSSPSSTVSCTNLTSIPIWSEVSGPLLEYLDKFLVAMAQVTEKRIIVVPGVLGTLKLPSISTGDSQEIYLYPKQLKLPVPKIVYKIIRYTSHFSESKTKSSTFEIAIVIHNEPNFEENDKLCKENKCQQWGWDSIQYGSTTNKKESKKSRHIYCCKVDDEFIEKIQFKTHDKIWPELNLANFPRFDVNLNKNQFSDRRAEFENIMDRLFPSNGSVDWDSIPNLNFEGSPDEPNPIQRSEKPKSTPKRNQQSGGNQNKDRPMEKTKKPKTFAVQMEMPPGINNKDELEALMKQSGIKIFSREEAQKILNR